jgi:hypothetical protein
MPREYVYDTPAEERAGKEVTNALLFLLMLSNERKNFPKSVANRIGVGFEKITKLFKKAIDDLDLFSALELYQSNVFEMPFTIEELKRNFPTAKKFYNGSNKEYEAVLFELQKKLFNRITVTFTAYCEERLEDENPKEYDTFIDIGSHIFKNGNFPGIVRYGKELHEHLLPIYVKYFPAFFEKNDWNTLNQVEIEEPFEYATKEMKVAYLNRRLELFPNLGVAKASSKLRGLNYWKKIFQTYERYKDNELVEYASSAHEILVCCAKKAIDEWRNFSYTPTLQEYLKLQYYAEFLLGDEQGEFMPEQDTRLYSATLKNIIEPDMIGLLRNELAGKSVSEKVDFLRDNNISEKLQKLLLEGIPTK